jgi:hypothetical protein
MLANMRATMLLADSAQAVDGKLYVLGGGWNMMGPGAPTAVAVHIHVPWDQTNRQHQWRLELIDSDDQAVTAPGPVEDQPIVLEGAFEVGRPPGTPLGSEQGVSIAVNIGPLPLTPGGRYVWRLSIDGDTDETWRLPFSVIAVQAGAAPAPAPE